MRYTSRAVTFCALAIAALTAAPSLSKADPAPAQDVGVAAYANWTPFSWVAGPGAWQQESPFTFSTSGPVILDVTDAFAQGDRFEIHSFIDETLGTTSQINNPANFVTDPDAAFIHYGFSHGSWTLPAGTYSLTFKTIQIAEGADSGTAYFRINPSLELSQVPEPGTLLLAACGAAGFAFPGLRRWTRRRPQEPVLA